MIICPRSHLSVRCSQRGYTLDEVKSCIVSEDGDQITVDVDHPAYPRTAKPGYTPQPEIGYTIRPSKPRSSAPTSGPGTELKKLLKLVGITASPTCSCNTRARTMDANGCDWCEANIDTIVGWLREEATKRKLPFVDLAGRLLVKRAICNARKAAS
jgi:hypothetical protein